MWNGYAGVASKRTGNLAAAFGSAELYKADVLSLACGVHGGHENVHNRTILLEILAQVLWLNFIKQTPHEDFRLRERRKTRSTAAEGRGYHAAFLSQHVFVLSLDVEAASVKAVLHGHDALVERVIAVQHESEPTRSALAPQAQGTLLYEARAARCARVHPCALQNGRREGSQGRREAGQRGRETQNTEQATRIYLPSRPNISSHSASSPYWAQYSRKPSLVVEKETPNTIILAVLVGGPSAPGSPELGMSGIMDQSVVTVQPLCDLFTPAALCSRSPPRIRVHNARQSEHVVKKDFLFSQNLD